MEIQYLETVLTTAKYLSFSRAAEEIPCAQSSVSRQVGIVENELGAKIFTRSSKTGSVELTQYGTQAIPMIREIVEKYVQLRNLAYKTACAKRTSYRLGVLRGAFNSKVRSDIVSEMFLRHPEIFFTVQEIPRGPYMNLLLRGHLDAMVTYCTYINGDAESLPASVPSGIICTELFGEIPHIAMPLQHPLASRNQISFQDLREETFLLPIVQEERGNEDRDPSYTGFLKSCSQAGFTPKMEMLRGETIADIRDTLVAVYGCMYPTFQTNAMRHSEKAAFIPVKDPLYYAKYYFLTTGTKPAPSAYVQECVAELLTRGDAGIFYG